MSNLDKYEEFVGRMMFKDGVSMPIEYICLGLVGEYGELEEALGGCDRDEVLKELGDVLWYATALFLAIRPLGRPYEITERQTAPTAIAGICDHVKKNCWHGKDLDYGLIQNRLNSVMAELLLAATALGWTIEDVAQANMDKLEKRYPQGFVEGGGIRD